MTDFFFLSQHNSFEIHPSYYVYLGGSTFLFIQKVDICFPALQKLQLEGTSYWFHTIKPCQEEHMDLGNSVLTWKEKR